MQDSGSVEEMPVEMVESFPFGERGHGDGKTERKQEERGESVNDVGVESLEIQESRKREDADHRKVVFVFRVEIELECRYREREEKDVSVGSSGDHVRERSENREIRKHRSGVCPYGPEFAELADPRKPVEYGDRFQKNDREGGTDGIETEHPYRKGQGANVGVRQKEEVSEAALAGICITAEKHDRRDRREGNRDVRDEQIIDFDVGEEPVNELREVDGRKHERVGAEYLRRDVVLRSKDGERGEGDYRKRERKPTIEFLGDEPHRRRERIGDAVEREVEEQEPQVVRSGFEELQRVLFGFGSDFRSADRRSVLFFLLEIERSESEKKDRSENEENDGFGKPSEKIKNRGENEVYKEKQDVHRLEVNSKRCDEDEREGREGSERNPRSRLLKTERDERDCRESENVPVGKNRSGYEFENRIRYGEYDRVGKNRICEEIPERTAEVEKRFGVLRSPALEFHIGNGAVLNAAGKELDVLLDHLTLHHEPIALFALEGEHPPKEFAVDFGTLGFVRLEFADVFEIQELVRRNFGIGTLG